MNATPRTLTLPQPDDWHLHLRDGTAMHSVLPDTARQFGRAIIMPNLKPPITTVAQAEAYRERILAARPAGSTFEPLMTLYLTGQTNAETVHAAALSPWVHAIKHYPAGATTNSDAGVAHLLECQEVLAAMEETGLPLLIHGEVVDPNVDIFDRERVFIDRTLRPLLSLYPRLKVVLEHITTEDAARFVLDGPDTLAATLTAHHLLLNRNAMLVGGIRPHYYCLPILKRERHRQALLHAATSGHPRFFLGTDSAPHAQNTKEAACGCAGMYTARTAIELYAEAFASVNALDKLPDFASRFGPAFYGLPVNSRSITLVEQSQDVPASLNFGEQQVVPFRAGETVAWCLQTPA